MSLESQRIKILIGGILSLIVMLGIARFAYTSLIPVMESGVNLTPEKSGWLAATNYIGYMLGALIATVLVNLKVKDLVFRIGLALAIISTFGMGLTDNLWLWLFFRFIAGLSSAAGLLICSGLIMNWLIRHHFKSELGIHFSGLGLGIIFAAVTVQLMGEHFDWAEQWLIFGLLATILSIPAYLWIPKPDTSAKNISGKKLVDNPPTTQFQWLLMASYFCAGWGYVIHATFIVVIVENLFVGLGQWMFLIVGVAAAPGVILWDKIAAKIGVLNALLIAFVLQIFGILLLLITDSLVALILSAVLYGFTFLGIVGLVLSMAGRFYPTKPTKLMGKMTLGYGVSQIVAPAIAGTLAARTGDYNDSVLLAAVVMIIGSVIIVRLRKL